jgi:HK97 family phage major capsid protein
VPYNNITDAGNVGKLIPEATVSEILKNVPQQSAAMQLMRKVPLSTRTVRQNVLSALPMAYFVNGDTGLKQTTELAWDGVTFVVEEIATILPIPQNVVDDSDYDIIGESRPLIEEAIGRAIDAAIFFGINKPASWPAAIVPGAVAAGNFVDLVAADVEGGAPDGAGVPWGIRFENKLSDLYGKVENDGFGVNGVVYPLGLAGRFRTARDANGNRLFEGGVPTYGGIDFVKSMDGLWPTGDLRPEIVAGDFQKGIIGIRKDITYEMFREGVITDNTNAIIYNLLQQDMIAMRVTMRLAWVTSNPISYLNITQATRWPWAVMRFDVVP